MSKRPTIKSIEEEIKDLEYEMAVAQLKYYEQKYGMSLSRLINKYNKKREKEAADLLRYSKMCHYENFYWEKGFKLIGGVDEAGRGPLAGPVVAAVVILPEKAFIKGLKDSKKLTPNKRNELFSIIQEVALSYGIGVVDEKTIDEINILNATKRAMKQAINSMIKRPDLLLMDAVEIENLNIEQKVLTKGDSLSVSIAAASILAKVTRDRMIEKMDGIYPMYGFSRHKGYGTKEHIEAIKRYGICPIHRISFTKKITV